MKKFLSIFIMLFLFSFSLNSFAQDSSPEVELFLPFPSGEYVMGDDGNLYVLFTLEQHSELIRTYNSYNELSEICFLSIIRILELSKDLNYYKKLVFNYELENETLRIRYNNFKEENEKLQLKLKEKKKQRVGTTIGLTIMTGIATGLIGISVGKTIR